jgi:hypothetical protein
VRVEFDGNNPDGKSYVVSSRVGSAELPPLPPTYTRPQFNGLFTLHVANTHWSLLDDVKRLVITLSRYATASVPRCTRRGIEIQTQKKTPLHIRTRLQFA